MSVLQPDYCFWLNGNSVFVKKNSFWRITNFNSSVIRSIYIYYRTFHEDFSHFLEFLGLNLFRTTFPTAGFSECVSPVVLVFSPRLLSKVLLQLDLGELSEIAHVLHPQSLHNGFSQLPSQTTTEDQAHIMLSLLWHTKGIIISWYRWIYLHFSDGKGAEELWNGSQRQNCLAIGLV